MKLLRAPSRSVPATSLPALRHGVVVSVRRVHCLSVGNIVNSTIQKASQWVAGVGGINLPNPYRDPRVVRNVLHRVRRLRRSYRHNSHARHRVVLVAHGLLGRNAVFYAVRAPLQRGERAWRPVGLTMLMSQ